MHGSDAWKELVGAIDKVVDHRSEKLHREIEKLEKRIEALKLENRQLRDQRVALASATRKAHPTFLSAVIPTLVEQYTVKMDTPLEDVPWRDAGILSILLERFKKIASDGYRPCLYDLERISDRDLLMMMGFGSLRLREARLFVRATRAREAAEP